MTEDFPLPPELAGLEQDLAARPRGQPSAHLKSHCMGELHVELLQQQSRRRWAFAIVIAASVLVGMNLSLSAGQATDCGLQLAGPRSSVRDTADEIRRLLPDMPPREVIRQAILLRAGAGVVPCPNVPGASAALMKNTRLPESEL
jgi:sulfite exporter TauE/SafE